MLQDIFEYILDVDYFVLEQLHGLAVNTGSWMTILMKIISALGNKGICVFLLAIALMLFPKTRKTGICIFGAVCCGTIIGNGILKYGLDRLRPFHSSFTEIYDWWQYVGAPVKDSPSFPSGHTMAIAAGVWAIYLIHKRKICIMLLFVLSFLMGVSRCYLMVHWFTDIVGGLLLGVVSAYISYIITQKMYKTPKLQNLLQLEILKNRNR